MTIIHHPIKALNAIILCLVYFSLYQEKQNAAVAFYNMKQPPAKKFNIMKASPIGTILPQSDKIIHVGNLDWSVPIDNLSQMITNAVDNNNNNNNIDIQFSRLRSPRRKRDEGKFHGGSAKVAFPTAEEATMAMQSLQLYSDSNMGTMTNLRLRWATLPKVAKIKVETILSEEQIQHRMDRAESYARRRQRLAKKTDEVIELLLQQNIDRINTMPILDAPQLDWSQCPAEIDPMRGGGIQKGTSRGERKQAAVEAFLFVVKVALLEDNNEATTLQQQFVADLGCGAGNLSIPLAWWLQKQGFGVLGIDINGQALDMLEKRASRAQIPIETLEKDLLALLSLNGEESSKGEKHPLLDCAAVVSLHACGAASDLSMEAAVLHNLPFAISPCCIGSVNKSRSLPGSMPALSPGERSARPPELSYPRSTWLNDSVSLDEYKLLASAADYGVGTSNKELDKQEISRQWRCRMAKQIIETDRLQWAEEKGYCIRLLEMPRIGPLYPKRELLLGAKRGSSAAMRIAQLSTVHQ